MPLGVPRMYLSNFGDASWGVLGAPWRSRGRLGVPRVPRGASWGLLGVSLGPLRGFLGASWGLSMSYLDPY
eukprot:9878-Pyramimonas_sp.AAC.1